MAKPDEVAARPPLRPISASTEQLLDSSPDGVVIIDACGVIRLVNRQTELMFGYPREELIGQQVEILVPDQTQAGHPTVRAEYFAHPIARTMGAGLELPARRKDGTEFAVEISLSSLKTLDGVLVSAAVRDVTDRKRIEVERDQLEARLVQAHRDEERAVLENQLHEAQRLESVGQLAGGVAHDFNNLLAAIMNYAALVTESLAQLSDRLGLSDDETFVVLTQDVDEITNVAKRAAAMTRQLLIASRCEVVQPEVLDLNSVVADMETLLRRTIGENVHLETTFARDLPTMKADRGQVEQLFMNLAVNARDAMPAGGTLAIATTTLEVDSTYAHLHAISPGTYVQLSVRDTGTGMAPDVVARVFEPYFSTKAEGDGSGLGLPNVYGIATQAGGAVAVQSEYGVGTTVRVNFPASAEALASPRVASSALPPTGHETILLVEDEEALREPARRILVGNGYTVLATANAEEALDIIRSSPSDIHLLLTDVVMPGRSGKDLAVAVHELRPQMPILFMSGYGHDVIVHQGVLEPGVHLLEKPFLAQDLLRRVRRILDGHR